MTRSSSISAALAPVETHVHAQVTHLGAVVAVLRELQAAEEQYAEAYADLPFCVAVEAKQELAQLPWLQHVCSRLGYFVRKSAVLKASVAKELVEDVLAPLERFAADHAQQAKHVLSELYELLQKEEAFDQACQHLKGRASRPEGAADGERERNMQQLGRRRDAERLTIRQWLTVLHYAAQRHETQVQDAANRTLAIYERMASAAQALVQEAEAETGGDCDGDSSTDLAHERIGALEPSHDDNNTSEEAEEAWTRALGGFDCHAAMTSWMRELFARVVPVEDAMRRRLQAVQQLDQKTVKVFGGAEVEPLFAGLRRYHTLLTANVLDPIVRTLQFSRKRQERMSHALVTEMQEASARVQDAQGQASTQHPKLAALRARVDKVASPRSRRFLAKPRDNNGREKKPQAGAKQLRSRPAEVCDSELQGEHVNNVVERELTPEWAQLRELERNEVVQRQEMARALQQTAFVSVKTLELMVQDHLKHASAALVDLKKALQTQATMRPRVTGQKAELPWEHLKERFAARDDHHLQNQRHVTAKLQQEAKADTDAAGCALQQPVCTASPEACGQDASASRPEGVAALAVVAVVAVVVALLLRTCSRANQLQASWDELGTLQRSNAQALARIVDFSVRSCARQGGDVAV